MIIDVHHTTTATHSVRDIILCDLTLQRITLIIIDKMSTVDEYKITQERIKNALRAGYRLKIYDGHICIDRTLGLYIIECSSNQLELI